MEVALDLIERGESVTAIATEMGVSPPTLRARIADLSKKQGVLLQYREVQSLQLTELQARVLEAITPEKIEGAPLRDLIMSYKILKEKEQVIEGKPTEIKGLVAHLIHIEKQELALLEQGKPNATVTDLEVTTEGDFEFTDAVPEEVIKPEESLLSKLAELDDNDF